MIFHYLCNICPFPKNAVKSETNTGTHFGLLFSTTLRHNYSQCQVLFSKGDNVASSDCYSELVIFDSLGPAESYLQEVSELQDGFTLSSYVLWRQCVADVVITASKIQYYSITNVSHEGNYDKQSRRQNN